MRRKGRKFVDALKARWSSLRTAFGNEYRESKKYIASGSAATENYNSNWLYYSDCLFLIEHIRHRRMDENCHSSDDQVDENDGESDKKEGSEMSQLIESDNDEEPYINFEAGPSSSNAPGSSFDPRAEIETDEKKVLERGGEISDFIKFLSSDENKKKLFGNEKIIVENFWKLSEKDQDEVFEITMDIIEAKLKVKTAELSLDWKGIFYNIYPIFQMKIE